MRDFPTRFTSHLDLARLPWFDVADGRLVVVDPSARGAVDLHTHLALAYVRPNQVDLHKLWPKTELYLDVARPLDFEVYVNRNFTDADLAALKHDLGPMSATGGGMRRTHTLANLQRDMADLGMATSVLLAIDFPVLSDNAGTWLDAARDAEDIVCFGSVHPFKPGMEAELDRQVRLGARGIKVHPAVQLVRPDAKRALRLYRACGARKLPVLFHCGPVDIEPLLGRYMSQVKWYEKGLAECPETTFVLGHTGAMQFEEGIRLAQRYPNVYVELSSQSLPNVIRAIEVLGADKCTLGSDWPFYHQAIALAKVLMATEGDEAVRRQVLRGTAARLLQLS
jgi:predicted TIM-barrel fold metal-dependent hydrolase